ncbi:hypothetical protein VUR80DRAFT_8994 [Thermomyces stellatus]
MQPQCHYRIPSKGPFEPRDAADHGRSANSSTRWTNVARLEIPGVRRDSPMHLAIRSLLAATSDASRYALGPPRTEAFLSRHPVRHGAYLVRAGPLGKSIRTGGHGSTWALFEVGPGLNVPEPARHAVAPRQVPVGVVNRLVATGRDVEDLADKIKLKGAYEWIFPNMNSCWAVLVVIPGPRFVTITLVQSLQTVAFRTHKNPLEVSF